MLILSINESASVCTHLVTCEMRFFSLKGSGMWYKRFLHSVYIHFWAIITLRHCNLLISSHGNAMPKGLYFTAVVFSFFFSMPNLRGHWTDLNQTWTHIHLWLLFEKFGLNSPKHLLPWAEGLFGIGFELWPNISLQWNITVGNKFVNLRDSPTCPQIWWTLVHKWLTMDGEFLPTTLNFCIGSHCQPYHMDVI